MADGTRDIRALFFDIDGTLTILGTNHIPQSALDALAAVRARGISVIIATGRHILHARMVEDQLVPDGYITVNGQHCLLNGEIIRSQHVDPGDVAIVADQIARGLYAATVAEDDTWYLSGTPENIQEMGKRRNWKGTVFTLGVHDPATLVGRPITQFVLQGPASMDHIMLDATHHLESARWSKDFGDVIPVGGGKQVGMQAFLDRLGLAREQCAAFGDGGNDITMLEYAGVGVAMGNAEDRVKEHANLVTTDVGDDGVAHALEMLGLV